MKQINQLVATFSAVLLIAALAACTPTVEPGATQPTPVESDTQPGIPAEETDESKEMSKSENLLDGTMWDLTTLAGKDVSGHGMTLEFTGDTASGSDGCNRFSGGYAVEGNTLTMSGPFASTMMACPDADMEAAASYLAAIESAGDFSLGDGTLTIETTAGTLVFEAPQSTSLEGTKWVLTSTRSEFAVISMAIDEKIFFTIENNEIMGNGGCNGFGGVATFDDAQLSFSDLTWTEMYCEGDGVSEREAEFFDVLFNAKGYEIMRQALTIFDENGEMIATFRPFENSDQ